jgi:hypothetical protein
MPVLSPRQLDVCQQQQLCSTLQSVCDLMDAMLEALLPYWINHGGGVLLLMTMAAVVLQLYLCVKMYLQHDDIELLLLLLLWDAENKMTAAAYCFL